MRLDKAFRVILNSPIFPKMTVERATDRSVRFGAQDESQLRVFIIKVRSLFLIVNLKSKSPSFIRLQLLIARISVKNYNHVLKSSNDNNKHQIHRYVIIHFSLIFHSFLFQSKSSNTSASSDVIILDDTSPKQNTSASNTRKRSHSQSDSDASEKTNDLSKKSK